MNRKCKFAVGVGGFGVETSVGHFLGDVAETDAEGDGFFSVSELAEQARDPVGEVPGCFDFAQRGGGFDFAGVYILQQQAIEVAAMFGTVNVDAAATAFEGGAGLGKTRSAECRVWNGEAH